MNCKLRILAWTAASALQVAFITLGDTPLTVRNLLCEYKVDPLGIDVRKPRLSWELVSAERGVLQTSYEIRVALSEAGLVKGKVIWDSGKRSSDASIQVDYGGPALESRRIYYWQVRLADNHGHLSGWSKPARWEMGLLEPTDWKAKWITPDLVEDEEKSNPSPLLRREFSIDKHVERARLYATAMGLYEMSLNGKRVGDEYFTPGWTSYDFRYQYQTYDVTNSLKSGPNCLAVMLGDGWFRGSTMATPHRNSYGKKLAFLAQLVLVYKDGTQQVSAATTNGNPRSGRFWSQTFITERPTTRGSNSLAGMKRDLTTRVGKRWPYWRRQERSWLLQRGLRSKQSTKSRP